MASTISGTMLVPGVSRNKRLYREDVIGRAVERMRARIAAGQAPITMLTHHEAGDDSLRIVGHLTHVEQLDDGRARWQADLDDTPEAQGIRDRWKARSLNAVSIRGWWIGDTRTETGPDGGLVTTGDDLEINGLDFTKDPGVVDALIDPPDSPAETGGSRARHLITESVQIDTITETVEVDMPQATAAGEAATHTPAAADPATSSYADPGYLADHTRRLPVGTRESAIATWQHLTEATNTATYTEPQLKRIRERVNKALRGFGMTVDTENRWLVAAATPVDVGECWDYPDRSGTVSAYITNGPLSVSVSSWCVDPADLDAVARAAMDGACRALAALDPDGDGDIDPEGTAAAGDAGMAGEGGLTLDAATIQDALIQKPETSTTTEQHPTEEEPTVATTETPAAEAAAPAQAPAPGVIQLTTEQLMQLLATRTAPAAETAAAETDDQRVERLVAARIAEKEAADVAARTAAAAQETEDQRIERLAEERYRDRVQTQVATGQLTPQRKGVQRPVDENNTGTTSGELNEHGLPAAWPNKPLHKFTAEERQQYVATAMTAHVLGDRA